MQDGMRKLQSTLFGRSKMASFPPATLEPVELPGRQVKIEL
jgi:hypothetical protein